MKYIVKLRPESRLYKGEPCSVDAMLYSESRLRPEPILPPDRSGINGDLNQTFGALTLSGLYTIDNTGRLDKTLNPLLLTAAAKVDIAAALIKTFGELIATGAGTVRVAGSLNKILSPLTISGASGVGVNGQLSKTLGSLQIHGQGAVSISAILVEVLDALTLVGAYTCVTQCYLDETLGSLTVDSAGYLQDLTHYTTVARSVSRLQKPARADRTLTPNRKFRKTPSHV